MPKVALNFVKRRIFTKASSHAHTDTTPDRHCVNDKRHCVPPVALETSERVHVSENEFNRNSVKFKVDNFVG